MLNYAEFWDSDAEDLVNHNLVSFEMGFEMGTLCVDLPIISSFFQD